MNINLYFSRKKYYNIMSSFQLVNSTSRPALLSNPNINPTPKSAENSPLLFLKSLHIFNHWCLLDNVMRADDNLAFAGVDSRPRMNNCAATNGNMTTENSVCDNYCVRRYDHFDVRQLRGRHWWHSYLLQQNRFKNLLSVARKLKPKLKNMKKKLINPKNTDVRSWAKMCWAQKIDKICSRKIDDNGQKDCTFLQQ